MRNMMCAWALAAALAAGALAGCAAGQEEAAEPARATTVEQAVEATEGAAQDAAAVASSADVTAVATYAGGVLDVADLFTERDLTQGADLSEATYLTVESGSDLTIAEEGVYVIGGSAAETTIVVQADDNAKVQLVLDGLQIENSAAPAIYVASADKVFVTLAGDNALSVTGSFAYAADSAADGVIFSRDDLVLNGTGTLTVSSTGNGIVGKDDVKVTGGTYEISAGGHGIQANDRLAVAAGALTIEAGKDGLHASNDEDGELGWVYVAGGTLAIGAGSDGIEASSVLQVDGGSLTVFADEGLEGTYVQINGGDVAVTASDDGINASAGSASYSPTIEINGGNVTVDMGQGDTDALDSNGALYINGGTVDITAQFAFDFDTEGVLSGGTVYVNGEQVTVIENSMMGGMGGGPGGRM